MGSPFDVAGPERIYGDFGRTGWAAAASIAIAILVVSAGLSLHFDSNVLGNDFAQAASVAHNLLAGNGLQTDLVYYDIHYELGSYVVPQTVFPPGFSLLLAPLLFMGMSAEFAGFIVCLVAYQLIAILLAATLRTLGVGWAGTVLATVLWLFLGIGWSNVLLCRSEVPYMLATVLSLYAIARWGKFGGRSMLLLASAGAAAAVLVRYQGLFFIGSLGLYFLFDVARKRDAASVGNLFLACSLPAITVLALVFRNRMVTGAAGGGPVDHVRDGAQSSEVLVSFYYEVSKILGVSREGLLQGGAAEVLILGFLCYVAWLVIGKRAYRSLLPRTSTNPAVSLCVIYVVVSMLALGYLAMIKSLGYAQARYISTIIPFVLMLVLFVASEARRMMAVPSSQVVVGFLLLSGSMVFGQARAIPEQLADVASDVRLREIRQALQTRANGRTIEAFLQSEIDAGRCVLSHESQLLGYALRRSSFGFTPAYYTDRIFDRNEVLTMVRDYDLKYLVFFPKLYSSKRVQNQNRAILTEFESNQIPEWLRPIVKSGDVWLFRVEL